MSKVNLITWDKSLAEHCPGLCREGVRKRGCDSTWGALGDPQEPEVRGWSWSGLPLCPLGFSPGVYLTLIPLTT